MGFIGFRELRASLSFFPFPISQKNYPSALPAEPEGFARWSIYPVILIHLYATNDTS